MFSADGMLPMYSKREGKDEPNVVVELAEEDTSGADSSGF